MRFVQKHSLSTTILSGVFASVITFDPFPKGLTVDQKCWLLGGLDLAKLIGQSTRDPLLMIKSNIRYAGSQNRFLSWCANGAGQIALKVCRRCQDSATSVWEGLCVLACA